MRPEAIARHAVLLAVCLVCLAASLTGQLFSDSSPPGMFTTSGMLVSGGIPLLAASFGRAVDFNANGRPDVIMYNDTTIAVMLDPVLGVTSTATGYEIGAQVFSAGVGTYKPIVCNLNGDQFPDFIGIKPHVIGATGTPMLANTHPTPFAMYLNQGDGTFQLSQALAIPNSLVLGHDAFDVDGNGFDDLIVSTWSATATAFVYQTNVMVLLNNGSGFVPTGITFPAAIEGRFSGHGDFNGDGRGDLLFMSQIPAALNVAYFVLFGQPNSTFSAPVSFPQSYVPIQAFESLPHIADLDNDGYDDFVIMTAMAPVYVVWGGPFTHLNASAVVPVGQLPAYTHAFAGLFDADQDGHVDILATDYAPSQWQWPYFPPFTKLIMLRGRGGRQFSSTHVNLGSSMNSSYPGTGYSGYGFSQLSFTPADFDGDGDLDVLGVPGSLGAPQTNFRAMYWTNNSILRGGCTGIVGVPLLLFPAAYLGNAGFALNVTGAGAAAPMAFIVSQSRHMLTGCGIVPNLAAGQVILPTPSIGLAMTDALGAATLGIPLPNVPSLSGNLYYIQAGVVDPLGAYQVVPGLNLALSNAHTVLIGP